MTTEQRAKDALANALPAIVKAAGIVARYCDHVEHNEPASRDDLVAAGALIRELSVRLFAAKALDPVASYAARLAAIEARSPLASPGSFDAKAALVSARTWHDLQLIQAQHDAKYHADVAGLSKIEQLRHYALHLAKLAWLTQEAIEDEALMTEYSQNRLPDLLLFGIKLATVLGVRLPDDPIV